jgi:hypothetical protein
MDQYLGASSDDLLKRPVPGGRALTTHERRTLDLSRHIPGWGSDLDPARRPGVPRDKAPDIGVDHLYPGFEQQVPRHRIHKSTEHARLTPVFGTSCPPRGLSGALRDAAYRRISRWLALLFADRIDVLEALTKDMLLGRPPNLVREMGLRSEWRHNRQGVIRKAVIAGFVVAGVAALWAATRPPVRRGIGRYLRR